MDDASLRVLANSGALDEIPNGYDGSGIESRIRTAGHTGGLVKDGVTRKSVLFVIYQTGRHGPQNGFRLALVLEGVRVEEARERLNGVIEQGAEEFVTVGP